MSDAPSPSHADDVASEVQVSLDELGTAWNAGDLDRFLDAHADESDIRYVSGGQIAEGRDAIRAGYAARFGDDVSAGSLGRLVLTATKLRRLSDRYVYVIARFELSVDPSVEPSRGIATLLMIRSGDRWRILEDHTS